MAQDSDSDEPLPSGSGDVTKDCPESELDDWNDALQKWKSNLSQRPKQMSQLVRRGIPEALRGEVWQLLAVCRDEQGLMDTYRILVDKESGCEKMIKRDINRTFPGHDYFRNIEGQESLYRLCKAYSIFDEEIGYCQGLSFVAAALLLHMSEEEAFALLVKIMHDYGLRTLFRCGFEELYLRFYQLERLMEDQMPDLFSHFQEIGVETHMFASQWFLTLFTAKFPLHVVFYILDIFLLDGLETIFKVAIALLSLSKRELNGLDFEGVLKHFRVQLPKKYRSDEGAKLLLKTAVAVKVKKLPKFEKEYQLLKEESRQMEDPVDRLSRENKRLVESNMRLEQENDDLAHELVTSKIHLRKELDFAEDRADTLNKELLAANTSLIELEDEKKRLQDEVSQLKEICRRELERAEHEISRNSSIISDYKQICSQLSTRLEKEQQESKESLSKIFSAIKECERCCLLFKDENVSQVNGGDEIDENGEVTKAENRRIRELELELARTKLALVEAECKNQTLFHHITSAQAEAQAPKNTWFSKTLTSIREATKKELNRESNKKEVNKDKLNSIRRESN
ncbi:rab GTPase-activating protein 1-like protein [Leptotrombidium deliense]|uniref:Rab GTPase-activating protein 1-like protein n=1 Tax=Leptotrombidium deliense TaxID=299467 RepID=A0A443SR87_9ACAR|nr:rab GTPase-activating protein 1-like protein [Leptotrombidium deliense]